MKRHWDIASEATLLQRYLDGLPQPQAAREEQRLCCTCKTLHSLWGEQSCLELTLSGWIRPGRSRCRVRRTGPYRFNLSASGSHGYSTGRFLNLTTSNGVLRSTWTSMVPGSLTRGGRFGVDS